MRFSVRARPQNALFRRVRFSSPGQTRRRLTERRILRRRSHVKAQSAPAGSRKDALWGCHSHVKAHSERATSRKSAFRRIARTLYARGEGGRDGSHAREHWCAGARQSAKGSGSIPSRTLGCIGAPGHTLDASYGPYVLYVLYAVYASYVPYAYGLRDILPSDWGMVR